MRTISLLLLMGMHLLCVSQADSTLLLPFQEDLLETIAQDEDAASNILTDEFFDHHRQLAENPIYLNELDYNKLDQLHFLSSIQKNALLNYIAQLGPLKALHELQSIPHFDLNTINKLLPYVRLESPSISPLSTNWKKEGKHQLILRWSNTIETKEGFRKDEMGQKPFTGSSDAFYARYRYVLSNRLSFGWTAEKDEGESFFSGSNKQGFDFYSAHLFLNNPSSKHRTIALGDYVVSMGQGLILFNGFSTRKGPLTTHIRRTGKVIRRYSSVNESNFFRGIAHTYAWTPKLTLTTFCSSKKTDANLDLSSFSSISSLQNTGKHRTINEIADERSVRQSNWGAVLKWRNRRAHLAWNYLHGYLNKRLEPNLATYNQFYFNGSTAVNMSIDYSYTWRNIHFFGESSISQNRKLATSNGCILDLDSKLDIAVHVRHFDRSYQSIYARPFAETTGGRNEQGIYTGITFRPANGWQLNFYLDQWRHPWMRFRTDAPATGEDWLLRLTYKKRKKYEAYIQLKRSSKMENQDEVSGYFDEILIRTNFHGRLHFQWHVNKSLEWRSRMYVGLTRFGDSKLKGSCFYQDLKYHPLSSPVSISVRYALFDTDDFAVRFYAYEHDVLNTFTIPAYYDRGHKYYLLLKWKINRSLLLEGRLARIHFSNKTTVGSGLDEIEGPTRTDWKLQLRYQF